MYTVTITTPSATIVLPSFADRSAAIRMASLYVHALRCGRASITFNS